MNPFAHRHRLTLGSLHQRTTKLEASMATLQETITAIQTDSSQMGDDLKTVAAQLAAVEAKLTAGEQVAADELAPITAQIHATADA
ncbi:MAG: hypothetical protein ACREQ5_38975, partial [Candidatus Dormibacteria bacterium]